MYKLFLDAPWGPVQQILRILDNAVIPFDLDNKDYIEYLEWVAQGNTPLPAEE